MSSALKRNWRIKYPQSIEELTILREQAKDRYIISRSHDLIQYKEAKLQNKDIPRISDQTIALKKKYEAMRVLVGKRKQILNNISSNT